MIIFAVFLILLGIGFTIIPLTHFSGQTFAIGKAIISGIGLPTVGIVIIVISSTMIINSKSKENKEIEDIANQVIKNAINSIENSNQVKKCKYCGTACSADEKNCPNCGAKLK